jgi:hypothetical protein
MTRIMLDLGRAVKTYAGPPADRMAGRPARAARAAKTTVSAATVAKAQGFLDREALLDEAVHQGVIGGALRTHYAACFDADPQGTRNYLAGIGLVTRAAATPPDQYLDTHLSTRERERIAAAREGKGPRVINGGL